MLINTYELVGFEVALLEPLLRIALEVGVGPEVAPQIILEKAPGVVIIVVPVVVGGVHHGPGDGLGPGNWHHGLLALLDLVSLVDNVQLCRPGDAPRAFLLLG